MTNVKDSGDIEDIKKTKDKRKIVYTDHLVSKNILEDDW